MTSSPKKKRRWLRFSLLSLLLLSMTIGSGLMLSTNLNPWQIHRLFPEFPREVNTAYISPDGSRVVALLLRKRGSPVPPYKYNVPITPTDDQLDFIQIWDIDAMSILQTIKGGDPYSIGEGRDLDCTSSLKGRWVVATTSGVSESIWDTTSDELLRLMDNPTTNWVWSVQISQDDRHILYARQGQLFLYDVQRKTSIVIGLKGSNSCRLSLDGNYIAVVQDNAGLLVWDIKAEKILWRETPAELSNKRFLNLTPPAFSPDGKTLAVSTYEPFQTHLFDVFNGKSLRTLNGVVTPADFKSLLPSHARGPFSPDSQSIATINEKDKVVVWDVQTGKEKFSIQSKTPEFWGSPTDQDRLVWAFSVDGTKFVGKVFENQAWDAHTGNPVDSYPSDRRWIDFQSFSADGKVRVVTNEKRVRVLKQVRPEEWYGVFWIPLFWTTLLLSIALIWSLVRDVLQFRNS